MSIAPVDSFPAAKSAQAAKASVRSGTAEEAAQPVSGTLPKQETSIAKNVPSTYELPADVVEVHQDPETKNQIIIQYLDKGRNVVLQVPSNQELSVERGISQDFQQAAKLRASADTATANDEGGKTHGD